MIGVTLVLLLALILGILPNAFNIIAISGIIVSLLVKFRNMYNKSVVWYILFILLGIVAVMFYKEPYLSVITGGFIGYGFFLVVMFTGVIPNQWDVTRLLKKNRGYLSILGFLAITPHAFLHVFGLFNKVDLFGIAAYVIMVPLTAVSFKVVKREINVKDWLTIQKGAYGIYLILFVHLLIVSEWQNKIVYSVLLTLYINNKLLKEYRR